MRRVENILYISLGPYFSPPAKPYMSSILGIPAINLLKCDFTRIIVIDRTHLQHFVNIISLLTGIPGNSPLIALTLIPTNSSGSSSPLKASNITTTAHVPQNRMRLVFPPHKYSFNSSSPLVKLMSFRWQWRMASACLVQILQLHATTGWDSDVRSGRLMISVTAPQWQDAEYGIVDDIITQLRYGVRK